MKLPKSFFFILLATLLISGLSFADRFHKPGVSAENKQGFFATLFNSRHKSQQDSSVKVSVSRNTTTAGFEDTRQKK